MSHVPSALDVYYSHIIPVLLPCLSHSWCSWLDPKHQLWKQMNVIDIDSRSVCIVHACRASLPVNYCYLVKGLRVPTVILNKEECIQKVREYIDSKYIPYPAQGANCEDQEPNLTRYGMTTTITSTIVQPTKDPQDGILMCPIVSAVRSPCYRLTKELAQIHSPLTQIHCQEHKKSIVENLQETQTTFHNHMVNLMWRNYTLECPSMRPLRVTTEELTSNQSLTERISITAPASWLSFLWSSYLQMRCQALSDLWLSEWDMDGLQEALRGREGNR